MPRTVSLCLTFVLPLALLLGAIDLPAQSIFTVAGGGADDGRPATVVALRVPLGVAIDRAGNLYVAEVEDHVVRRVTAETGIVERIAGTRGFGFSGDGGPATLAELALPVAVALDPSDNLLIVDGNRIRRVAAATGIITTIAGTGVEGFAGDGGPTEPTVRDRGRSRG